MRISAMTILLLGGLLLAPPAALAQGGGPGGNPGKGKGKPGTGFDEDKTPLQKGLEEAVGKRKGQGKPAPKVKVKKFDEAECPECGDIVNPNGKMVGKRIKTETILEFDNPGQRKNGATRWDPVLVEKKKIGEIGHGGFNPRSQGGPPTANGARLRQAVLFPDSSNNDDRDCIDRVTGEHLFDEGCFDANGDLLRNLSLAPTGNGCIHDATGTFVEGDTCVTSLEELIDEDGPEIVDDDNDGLFDEDPAGNGNEDNDCMNASGDIFRDGDCFAADGSLLDGLVELIDEDGSDPIDQDADGRFDEDPPAASLDDACRNFGMGQGLPPGLGDPSGDGCDLTRALIVKVNQESMARNGDKFFKADDSGNLDPSADGEVEFGKERRRMVLTETFAIKCSKGSELVEGECVEPPPPAALLGTEDDTPAPTPATLSEAVMMGFTFAPPVLEWGYQVGESVCIDFGFTEACFEIFFARVGYEFDMALGLRLPMEVEVTQIPTPDILAGQAVTLKTTIQPKDFTVQEYKAFCQKHGLANGTTIADCDRFAFPNFFDSLYTNLTPEQEETLDGDEFVARLVVFAGVAVRVVGVPVIQWGIDSAVDLPTMCTFLKLKDASFNLVQFGLDFASDEGLRGALKNQLGDCASFTTPFGLEADPLNPSVKRLRTFPFPTSKSFDVRADCAEALVRKETVTIKKKKRPICTGLVLGANGASLGIGLGMELNFGSDLVEAGWNATGDAAAGAGAVTPLQYRHSKDEGEPPLDLGPVRYDNFDAATLADTGTVSLDDFTLILNTVELKLNARLQFGGILSPLPDVASLDLYSFQFSAGSFGIPIGQHAGTGPVEIPVFVTNHALTVDGRTATGDTSLIRPGEFGEYQVAVRNLGSVPGTFDNLRVALSNRPGQSPPYVFGINPNTDFDCVDAVGAHFRGNPYNGVADDCYSAGGQVRSDRTELIDEDPAGPDGATAAERDADGDGLVDEDPVDDWRILPAPADLGQLALVGVPAYTDSGELVFSLSPFRHPLTAPGVYPVRVQMDSADARAKGLAATDPSGLARLGATDVVFLQVDSFFEPEVDVRPVTPTGAPGQPQLYSVTGTNFGNQDDSMTVAATFVDFNQAGCTLATLGSLPADPGPGCPYRAVPTAIPAAWTDVAGLGPILGPLAPLAAAADSLQVQVPAGWAGMEDTTYQVVVKVTSTGDPETPPATHQVVVEQTVTAGIESQSRYIGLQIDGLMADIEAANASGIATAGLLPLLARPGASNQEKALARAVAGDEAGARKLHGNNIRILQAFIRALDGYDAKGTKIPDDMAADWRARAVALIGDLQTATAP